MRQRHSRTHHEQESGIDMTPMLDIVFIMLIFFIVTTSFVKESGIEVNRPSGEETASRVENANIIVGIKPNGEVWIDKHLVDIRSVRANIARLHAENPLGAVIVAADKESKTKVLIQVMDQIRLAGVMNASIATDTD
jgi:biopolymer transport protein ExbD